MLQLGEIGTYQNVDKSRLFLKQTKKGIGKEM